MTWTGKMRTAYFDDDRIQPSEYRCWRDARTHFTKHPGERARMADLRESVETDGVEEPLVVGISDRDLRTYLRDGHHRAVVMMDLKEPWFPFQWYWIRDSGVHMEHEPFPIHLLTWWEER